MHLDFWVDYSSNHLKLNKRLDLFIKDILPELPTRILVIAGDLGHYNKQNYKFLEKLKQYYPYILLVPGNHDYYLISKSIKNKYKRNSIHRFFEMMSMAEQLPGLHFLDGNQVEIEGIVFGGCGMWYDFEYGIQKLNADWNGIFNHWKANSNDSVLIEGLPRRIKVMFDEEKAKLNKVLGTSDVIVTHIAPDWSVIPEDTVNDLSNSYYYFYGSEIIPNHAGEIWCYGHVHRRMDYRKEGCRFINASLGYPDENNHVPKRIINVTHE